MSNGRVVARRPPGPQANTCTSCGYGRIGNVCLWCNKCWTCGTKLKFSSPQRARCENPECPDTQKKGTSMKPNNDPSDLSRRISTPEAPPSTLYFGCAGVRPGNSTTHHSGLYFAHGHDRDHVEGYWIDERGMVAIDEVSLDALCRRGAAPTDPDAEVKIQRLRYDEWWEALELHFLSKFRREARLPDTSDAIIARRVSDLHTDVQHTYARIIDTLTAFHDEKSLRELLMSGRSYQGDAQFKLEGDARRDRIAYLRGLAHGANMALDSLRVLRFAPPDTYHIEVKND